MLIELFKAIAFTEDPLSYAMGLYTTVGVQILVNSGGKGNSWWHSGNRSLLVIPRLLQTPVTIAMVNQTNPAWNCWQWLQIPIFPPFWGPEQLRTIGRERQCCTIIIYNTIQYNRNDYNTCCPGAILVPIKSDGTHHARALRHWRRRVAVFNFSQ